MSVDDASRPVRRLPWQVAAWVWLALCIVVAVHQWTFWRSSHFGTDVMALLPQDEQAPEVGVATRQLPVARFHLAYRSLCQIACSGLFGVIVLS